jgi:phosphatidylglycerophosphate synthase
MTEGERWTREALVELRAGRFRPRAWRSLIAGSLVRARQQRQARRRAHRQALLLAAAGVTAWIMVGLTGRPLLALAGACWWLLIALMLDWHLGMLERIDGTPLGGVGIPNLLSLLRLAAVPTLPILSPNLLAVVLLGAGALDVLDGLLARARNEATRLGFWLDGVADGILLSTAALVLARLELFPDWTAAAVLARFAVPWLLIAAAAFALDQIPSTGRAAVSGRPAGVALLAGLVLAALGLPGGTPLAAAGAAAGVAAFAATFFLRIWRHGIDPAGFRIEGKR